MELNHRIYELNVQSNLDGQEKNIKVMRNGQDTGAKISHIFKNVWFETGKMIGYSILEYYSVQDGFLVDKEGNQVSFSSERNPEIKVNRIKKPGLLVFGEEEVSWQWVRDTGMLMGLMQTEETVKGLSTEEKKALQDEREVVSAEQETKKKEQEEIEAKAKAEEDERLAEEARKAEAEAMTAAEIQKAEQATKEAEEAARKSELDRIKAEREAEEAKKAEEEAKEQAEKSAEAEKKKAEEQARKKAEEEKQYIVSEKEYDRVFKRSKKLGMEEYVKGEYHFFYGKNLPKGEFPFILKKRIDDYLELEGGIVDENDEDVEFEFTDGKDKTLILDIDTADMTIE